MKTLATLTPLIERLRLIQHLKSAADILSWDQETFMPPAGGAARADQLATLQTLAHDMMISPEVEQPPRAVDRSRYRAAAGHVG
jgi:carboxypeptidase Taq